MKKLTAIMLKASDIVSLCFLIPLLFISLFLYRSVEFGTLRESTFEVRDNPFVNLLILFAVLMLLALIKKAMERCEEPLRWKTAYIITAACAGSLLIFGCVWISLNPFEALADQEEVWKAVLDLADGGGAVRADLLYFREYPQQKNMAVIMSVLAWITGKSIRGYNYLNLIFIIAAVSLTAVGIVGLLDVCEEHATTWSSDKKVYAAAGGLVCLGLLSFAAEQRSFEQSTGVYRDEMTNVYKTKDLHLPKGDYGIIVSYKATEDTEMMLYLENGGTGYPVALAGDKTKCEIPAYMDSYKDSVHFEYSDEYNDRIELDKISVYSPRLIYYDLFYTTFIIAVLLYPCYLLFVEGFIRKKSGIDKKGISFILFGVILAAPLAIYLGGWFHVRVICSRLRVSAEFSVYLTLVVLILMVFCVRYCMLRKRVGESDKEVVG